MAISSVSTAHIGMQRASAQLEHSASRIARIGVEGENVDIAEELTNVLIAKNDFKANVKVAGVASDMSKALLDIFV